MKQTGFYMILLLTVLLIPLFYALGGSTGLLTALLAVGVLLLSVSESVRRRGAGSSRKAMEEDRP